MAKDQQIHIPAGGAAMRAVRQAFLVAALGLGCVSPVQATYWSLFNAEGESIASSVYVTYDTLSDMLNDTNRTGTSFPNGFGAGRNVVGSGSNGTSYWSLFNAEGESIASSVYVTYDTLSDMLNDTNRTGTSFPNGFGAGRNVVGSGSDAMRIVSPVPVPATLTLVGIGFAGLGFARRRKAQ